MEKRNQLAKIESAEIWSDRAYEMKDQRDELAVDLERALNAMRGYQGYFAREHIPDPNFALVKALCIKYQMPYEDPRGNMGKVYADGKDITHDADSIEGTTIDTIELVANEAGELFFLLPEGSDD